MVIWFGRPLVKGDNNYPTYSRSFAWFSTDDPATQSAIVNKESIQPKTLHTVFSNRKIYGAEVAQLAEHSPEKAGVDSSILSLGTT